MAKEKIVLAYSGGLDTSVAIAWLMNKGYDVIACCIDVGEGLDLAAIQQKATAIGAWKSVLLMPSATSRNNLSFRPCKPMQCMSRNTHWFQHSPGH